MKYYRFGDVQAPAILLIHGMGCNAMKSFATLIHALEHTHCVIAVDLDGHDGANTTFTTIRDQAEKITTYLSENHISSLKTVLGMSLGGFIAMDVVCRCGMQAEKFIFDSGYVPPLPFKRALSYIVAWGFEKLIQGKDGFLVHTGMKALMGYCFKREQLCDTASRASIYNVEFDCMHYQLADHLSVLNKVSTFFLYGEREKVIIRGMRILQKQLPKMRAICMGPYGHGEMMFDTPEEYTQRVMDCLVSTNETPRSIASRTVHQEGD